MVLCVLYEVGADGVCSAMAENGDLLLVHVAHADVHHARQQFDRQIQVNGSVRQLHPLHGSFMAGKGSAVDSDFVSDFDTADGVRNLKASAILDTCIQKLLHHPVGHGSLGTVRVQIVPQPQMVCQVLLAAHEIVDVILRGFQKHDVSKVVRYATFLVFQEVTGVERFYDSFSPTQSNGIFRLQSLHEQLHFKMCHHIPTSAVSNIHSIKILACAIFPYAS